MHNPNRAIDRDVYKEHQDSKEDADFKYQVNQRLQNHDDKFLKISCEVRTLNEKLDQIMVDVNHRCYKTETMVNHFVKEQSKLMESLTKDVRHIENILSMFSCSIDKKVDSNECLEAMLALKKSIHDLYDENKLSRAEFNENLQHLSHHFSSKLERVKQELIDRPTGIEQIQKIYENRFEDMAISMESAITRFMQAHNHLKTLDKKFTILWKMMNVKEEEA